jgi:hypothetical protein
MPLLSALGVPLLSASVQRNWDPEQAFPSSQLSARLAAALPCVQRLLHSCLPAEQYQQAAAVVEPRLEALRCYL